MPELCTKQARQARVARGRVSLEPSDGTPGLIGTIDQAGKHFSRIGAEAAKVTPEAEAVLELAFDDSRQGLLVARLWPKTNRDEVLFGDPPVEADLRPTGADRCQVGAGRGDAVPDGGPRALELGEELVPHRERWPYDLEAFDHELIRKNQPLHLHPGDHIEPAARY